MDPTMLRKKRNLHKIGVGYYFKTHIKFLYYFHDANDNVWSFSYVKCYTIFTYCNIHNLDLVVMDLKTHVSFFFFKSICKTK